MKNKSLFFYFLLIILSFTVFANDLDYEEILNFRLENDELFSTIKNDKQIAENTVKRTKLNSYFSLDLTTGNVNILLEPDKTKSQFSMEPGASLSMPMANNLGLKASMPYASSNGGKNVQKGANVSVFFDLYSQTRNRLKLQINQSQRDLELANKKYKLQKQLIEKKLLSEIKKLFNEYSAVLGKDLAVAQANLKYKQTLAQGYNENSVKMRTSKMTLMQSERELKQAEYSFSIFIKSFLDSCTTKTEIKNFDEFILNLAMSIPKSKLISTDNLNQENYLVLINAKNDFENAILKNKINLNTFSATTNTTFSLSKIENKNNNLLNTESKSVTSGVSMKFPGCKLYTGVKVPIKSDDKPTLQLSFSFNPLQIYDYVLLKKNMRLNEANALINLNSKKNNFENELKTFIIEKEKFEWEQKLYNEEIEVYYKNAIDHANWFNKGIISKWENQQADLQYKQSLLRAANANIDAAIFNVRVQEAFEIEAKPKNEMEEK